MSSSTPRCPRCGEKMIPVLDKVLSGSTGGPVPPDPQVSMRCTACPPVEAPSLTGG